MNTRDAAVGGVGVILDKQTTSLLANMHSLNNRILILYFSGNPATTIVIQYAPVEGSTDAEIITTTSQALLMTLQSTMFLSFSEILMPTLETKM